MSRPTQQQTWAAVARVVAERSTCARRRVGCVLLDDEWRVVSTGYNGVVRGAAHCTTTPCEGAAMLSGTGLEWCEAVHAEQNAVLQATRKFSTVVVTTFPCVSCAKLFLNGEVESLYYVDDYPASRAIVENLYRGRIEILRLREETRP